MLLRSKLLFFERNMLLGLEGTLQKLGETLSRKLGRKQRCQFYCRELNSANKLTELGKGPKASVDIGDLGD